jgi:DNA-binding transcriptional MerR regulator
VASLLVMAGKLLTTGEAADALGFARGTLARWEREGLITPATKSPGGHSRWDLDDLREQLRVLRQRDE